MVGFKDAMSDPHDPFGLNLVTDRRDDRIRRRTIGKPYIGYLANLHPMHGNVGAWGNTGHRSGEIGDRQNFARVGCGVGGLVVGKQREDVIFVREALMRLPGRRRERDAAEKQRSQRFHSNVEPVSGELH